MSLPRIRSTTVLAVRRAGQVAIGGDGQVTMGNTVVKGTARKIRRLYDNRILAGFAGSAADGITLFEKFEARLKDANGNLLRGAVELAKDWRTDRVLRRLEALLLVADRERILLLSGTGDVIEPDGDAAAIGSGEAGNPAENLVAQNCWNGSWSPAGEGVDIASAQGAAIDLHQDFASLWDRDRQLKQLERLA